MLLKRISPKPQIIAGEKKNAISPFLGFAIRRKSRIIIKYAQPESSEKIKPPYFELKICFISIV